MTSINILSLSLSVNCEIFVSRTFTAILFAIMLIYSMKRAGPRIEPCNHSYPCYSGWFWGDPHFKTLDGGNYTFNGLGEYVMIDAQDGTFQLQARTSLAQGNSTAATIFTAGVAKEKNTSTVEVRVKNGGDGFNNEN